MKRSFYFRGKDMRAVENPYDAAFRLAEKIKKISTVMMIELIILLLMIIFHFFSSLHSVKNNLFEIEPGPLNYLGAILAIPLIPILIILVIRLISSIKFLRDFRMQHKLLHKIGEPIEITSHDPQVSEPVIKETPQKGLIELIRNASDHSKKLSKTLMVLLVLLAVLIINITLFVIIQYFRASDFHYWEENLGWELPSGLHPMAIIIQIIIMFLLFFQFRFIKNRYGAIDYSLKQKPIPIPKGKYQHSRIKKYLFKKKVYSTLKNKTKWKKDDYFIAKALHTKGWLFIKCLKRPPTLKELTRFRKQCKMERNGRKIERAILIYTEDPEHPLSEEVYNSVIDKPLRTGTDICNIQLVEESSDGTYDFIPVISF